MPSIELSNDEYEAVLRMREAVDKPNGYCEDYPCCGHTPDDPCTRQWYDTAAGHAYFSQHSCCDHEAGWCEVDDRDDDSECEHDNKTYIGMSEIWTCDYCGEESADAQSA